MCVKDFFKFTNLWSVLTISHYEVNLPTAKASGKYLCIWFLKLVFRNYVCMVDISTFNKTDKLKIRTLFESWLMMSQGYSHTHMLQLVIGLEQFKPKGKGSQEHTEWVPFRPYYCGSIFTRLFWSKSAAMGDERFHAFRMIKEHVNRVDLRGITVPSKEILIYRLWIRIYATPSSIGKPIWICFFLKINET